MHRRDIASGSFWLGISVLVGIQAFDLGVGTFSNPGAGFILFWSSFLVAILAAFLVIRSIRTPAAGASLSDPFRGLKWMNVVKTVLSLLAYTVLLEKIGFLLISFLFMTFLYQLGHIRFRAAVGSALVTIATAYAIFHFALQVQFPRGFSGW